MADNGLSRSMTRRGRKRAMRDLYAPVSVRTSNEAEIAVAQDLEREGWTVYKRGWPDFVAVRGREVRFIEVKPTKDCDLSNRQRIIANILIRLTGLPVEVVAPDHPPRFRDEIMQQFGPEFHADEQASA